jgi:hypothetical protein
MAGVSHRKAHFDDIRQVKKSSTQKKIPSGKAGLYGSQDMVMVGCIGDHIFT